LLTYVKKQGKFSKSISFLARIIPEVLFDSVNLIDILRINDREGIKIVKKIYFPHQFSFKI